VGSVGNIRYNDKNVIVTIEFVEQAQTQTPECEKTLSKEECSYIDNCEKYGLKKEWLGKSFTFKGTNYRVIGFAPRSTIYPVLCSNSKGDIHKLSISALLIAFSEKFNSSSDTGQSSGLTNILGSGAPLFLVNTINRINLFRKEDVDLSDPEQVISVAKNIANYLSPENLFADGERTRSEAKRLESDVLASLRYLSRVTGQKLDPHELNSDY
jgi:hypothetical protein